MEFFHVLNRGVDKRAVVLDDEDRLRFVHSLFVLNDEEDVDPNHTAPSWHEAASDRVRLVDIHVWCLMKNHYHLLISPADDDPANISRFMKKLNMGYAKYFNDKYERTGALWQGKYKKIPISGDAHHMHLPYYIHLNPLDYVSPEWRVGGVTNPEKALQDLREYRWSSHLDYLGEKNFGSVIQKDMFSSILGPVGKYTRTIREMINDPARASLSDGIK